MRPSSKEARQRILDVASDLFYHEGIRSIGVDTIAEKARASKATLYRHFPTKDDLVIAYLQEKSEAMLDQFDQLIQVNQDDPLKQIYAFVDVVIESFSEPEYRGCVFLNAFAEYSDMQHPVHRLILHYNEEIRIRLVKIIKEAGAEDDSLADELLLVINGAFSLSPIMGIKVGPVAQLKKVVTSLIKMNLK